MGPVRTGVQWTSRATTRTRTPVFIVALALALPVVFATTRADAATDYILMSRSALLARPVSGAAWTKMHEVAVQGLGTPSLCDQNDDHHLRTLAAALVYARTGAENFGVKARAGVMAAIGTSVVGCNNATVALGRQLAAYAVAIDGMYLLNPG
jgi:hypothetical protein